MSRRKQNPPAPFPPVSPRRSVSAGWRPSTGAAFVMAEVATALGRADPDEVEPEIERCLGVIGRELELQALTLLVDQGERLTAAAEWRATGWMDPPLELERGAASWSLARLDVGEPVPVDTVAALPEEAAYERQHFGARGSAAFLLMPVQGPPDERRYLAAERHGESHSWTRSDLAVMETSAGAIGGALQRRAYQRRLLAEVAAARKQAERSTRFLALLGHELRHPLQGILGYAELLRLSGGLDEDQRASVAEVLTGAVQLRTLIQATLDLARLEEGRMRLDYRDFDVAGAITGAVRQVLPRAQEAGLTVTTELEADDVRVRADWHRLQQVLSNLLSNAIKFTPAGGHVTVRLSAGDERYTIEVIDTGPGIAPRDHARIFDAYALVKRDGERDSIGLGLPLVKRLVELHGGRVELDSDLGTGSTFRVILPQQPPPPPIASDPYVA